MGTSNSYGGQHGGSLIPSWLGGAGGSPAPDQGSNDGDSPDEDGLPPGPPPPPPPREPPQLIPLHQFTRSRTNFTRFAKSGGQDRRTLGRAVSAYVSGAAGGHRQAAQRMGASRTATATLVNFLSASSSRGVVEALREIRLENLAGRPIEEIFIGLADYVCPEGGTVDEGIARNAFVETIADLAELGITDLDSLSVDQMQTVLELYATHAIEARLCNDIGIKIAVAPNDLQAFDRVHEQLHDFILRAVSDALTRARQTLENLAPTRTLQFVEHIYTEAFRILQSLGDQEAAA